MKMTNEPIRPAVVFFDVNETLLDLSPLRESLSLVLEGRGELLPLWFTTMLQYSLVETVTRSYREFGEIGAAVLTMVAANHGIALNKESAREAMEPLKSLPPHPDVFPAMERLKEAGFTLAALTNSPQAVVDAQLGSAGISGFFEKRLSVGSIETFKPHVTTYQWAAREMGVASNECILVAAHGWDIAGALRAGLRGLFVSRPGAQLYPLADPPEHSAPDLMKAADYLTGLWGG